MPEGFFEVMRAFHIRNFLGISFIRRYFRFTSFLESLKSQKEPFYRRDVAG